MKDFFEKIKPYYQVLVLIVVVDSAIVEIHNPSITTIALKASRRPIIARTKIFKNRVY